MEFTAETLADFIEEKTREYWKKNETPFLLADVGPAITKAASPDFNYKALIAPLSLKQFVAGMSGKVKVVQHATHKAKVGVIPANEDFEFGDKVVFEVSMEPKENPTKSHSRSNKYIVLNFLQALASLDDSELDKVVIPASVLAKLLKEK
ncbi:hypothetical protein F4V91_06830 [Neorhizobium galegae]|uniref:Uncharacterized protein n=1 Tax=Neorhizobium galegae TaxID=399 RepID=A0A6A1TNF4_NEOGA|nr:hypothetical protein [Neorhizobium galegae]KAB1086173.1 hypothetical protein F4V91_06830 [Neorhizobium galegae]